MICHMFILFTNIVQLLQWRGDSGNQWNGGYSRGQGYNNGYANQDSNMYANAAAAVPGAS